MFPSRPISTNTNKQAILIEAQMAKGHSINDTGISDVAVFNFQSYYSNNSNTTTVTKPSQFFVGVNTEKLRTNNSLLSGISTNNSNITYRINTSISTGGANKIVLVAVYDALIEIDPLMKQATVKQ